MLSSFNRREFMKTSAVFAAGMAMPSVVYGKVRGANDRINIGVIGCGGQGYYHVDNFMKKVDKENIKVTHVCDVYRRRLNRANNRIGGDEKSAFIEYERILDNKDINAVLIATPDHWHTKIAIEAMQAGKDVYVEKPLSLTVEQAIECRDAARKLKKVLAVGPQGTSEDRWWKARDAIAAGRIGKVVWSQGAYCRNSREGQFNWPIDADAGPTAQGEAFVDWDRWLGAKYGLAKQIPWNPDHFFRFRKYYAYNGGVATDLMFHRLAPLLLAIHGPDGEYPRRVMASGGQYIEKDGRDIADTMLLNVDYATHTVLLASVMVNDVGVPDVIRGQYGEIEPGGENGRDFGGSGWRFTEPETWAPEFRKANADMMKGEPKKGERASFGMKAEGNKDGRTHDENWLDAIRGKGKPNCGHELGCATMVAIKMGVESYRQSKVFTWDAKNEKVMSA